MSTVAFIRRCLESGMEMEMALVAAEAFEAQALTGAEMLTARQARNRRYYETKRLKTSESKTLKTISDDQDAVKTVSDAQDADPRACVRDITTNLDTTGDYPSEAKASSGSISRRALALAKPNGFARFWDAYPRKVGRPKAEAAYAKALKRIAGPDPPATILAGLERNKPSWRDPDFIPHPTTWLNRDGWEDQPTIPKAEHERVSSDPPRGPSQRTGHRTDANIAGAGLALMRRNAGAYGSGGADHESGPSGAPRLLAGG